MHGSYFINLSGKKDVVEASKERLLGAVTAADWMNAYVVSVPSRYYAVTGSGGQPANAADFGGTLPSGTVTLPTWSTLTVRAFPPPRG